MSLTESRVRRFIDSWLSRTSRPLGFADIGSGGTLKNEWARLGTRNVDLFAIDPETWSDPSQTPPCISDRPGVRPFYVARDPRGSSLQRPNDAFIERFGLDNISTVREIEVACQTVDTFLANHIARVDVIDINVEGHDWQCLKSATRLFSEGLVKCIRVEFEVVEVWEDQGWLSDMDAWLRARGMEQVKIGYDRVRPVPVRRLFGAEEPVWGKAVYMPGSERWQEIVALSAAPADEIIRGVALATAHGLPGRADDLLSLIGPTLTKPTHDFRQCRDDMYAAWRFSEIEGRSAELWQTVYHYLRAVPYMIRTTTRSDLRVPTTNEERIG